MGEMIRNLNARFLIATRTLTILHEISSHKHSTTLFYVHGPLYSSKTASCCCHSHSRHASFCEKKTMSIIVYDDYRVEYTLGTENISKS